VSHETSCFEAEPPALGQTKYTFTVLDQQAGDGSLIADRNALRRHVQFGFHGDRQRIPALSLSPKLPRTPYGFVPVVDVVVVVVVVG
jgi:hypothetical protein